MDLRKNQTKQTLEEQLDFLKQLQNAANLPLFDLEDFQDKKIDIKPDESITPGNFKPHPLRPGLYFAHPQTIMAMKKNILTAGDNLDELSQNYSCHKCDYQLDLQFWNFCPSCMSEIKE